MTSQMNYYAPEVMEPCLILPYLTPASRFSEGLPYFAPCFSPMIKE